MLFCSLAHSCGLLPVRRVQRTACLAGCSHLSWMYRLVCARFFSLMLPLMVLVQAILVFSQQ